jgi:hypothetical protein
MQRPSKFSDTTVFQRWDSYLVVDVQYLLASYWVRNIPKGETYRLKINILLFEKQTAYCKIGTEEKKYLTGTLSPD